jgi:pimeloyl-ACP methyl ester carboxylesterase
MMPIRYLLLAAMALLMCGLPKPLAGEPVNNSGNRSECVILLHGLGRTENSMDKMASGLKQAGFLPINMDYPSTKHPIEVLAEKTIPEGLERCRQEGADTVHAVTHSMGGLLLRYYLTQHTIPQLGKVVMLSPPNQGSEAADLLQDVPLYQWLNGPAGQQLGTDPNSLPAALGPVNFPLGVITGSRSGIFDFWLSSSIPGTDDGKVSVERAKVDGMAGFLVLPYSHTFIMQKKEVIEQTIYFLRNGEFRDW